MARQEIHLELLLGKRVYAQNGRAIGRLEEVCVELNHGDATVNEFEVGSYALFERLAAWEIGRAVLGLFGVKWNQLDLSDPERPKLNCSVTELAPLKVDE